MAKSNIVKIKVHGDFNKTYRYFDRLLEPLKISQLDHYGKMGVSLLKENTPIDTGLASNSWDYIIEHKRGKVSVIWLNDDIEGGQNIAIILQYGHATNNGGYVKGRDYINPALQPLFDKMAKDMWEEVIHE